MKRRKLVIISHTEHYYSSSNRIVGLGATVAEVNYLSNHWEEIVHIAPLHTIPAPADSLFYNNDSIRFVPLPVVGGATFFNKISILTKAYTISKIVFNNLNNASEVQLRLPTAMGLFLLPLSSFFLPKNVTFWIKYAGNWNQQNPPLSYRLQRWWLKNDFAKAKVTINGFWKNQPQHCLSFENPCLTESDLQNGAQIREQKTIAAPFTFCFIGRLESAKGIDVVIAALQNLPITSINHVHIIGDGVKKTTYQKALSFLGKKVTFHGFLSKQNVHQCLSNSDFLLLPSLSEGFPKVIAEAACYGVIPVVSNVGAIPHYVNATNGFLWDISGSISYTEVLQHAINSSLLNLKSKADNLGLLAAQFTFEAYYNKLEKEILLLKRSSNQF